FSDIVAVELSIVGLEELANISGLAIYPNPASDFLNVSLDLKENVELTVEMINSLGQKVFLKDLGSLKAGAYIEQISLKDLAPGLYEVVLRSDKGEQTISIVVE
ncbi:MAG: hypothetical protein ACI8XB_003301, partial [Patiriisocius sp.]